MPIDGPFNDATHGQWSRGDGTNPAGEVEMFEARDSPRGALAGGPDGMMPMQPGGPDYNQIRAMEEERGGMDYPPWRRHHRHRHHRRHHHRHYDDDDDEDDVCL